MAERDWQPLPTPMWPAPAAWADAGEFMLLVFTRDGVPTWEVHGGRDRRDPVATGTADTFEAAKQAALFSASAPSAP